MNRPYGDPENPTYEEIERWVGAVMEHSATVERYLDLLEVRVDDGQHPHDITGPGNKLEWLVIRGIAPADKSSPERQRRYQEALGLHRQGQRHHQMWNDYNPAATEADLKYGAIDAIASLRESREYQGGVRSWEEITNIIESKNAPHKQHWMRWAMEAIQKIEGSR